MTLPIACTLTPAELAARRAGLLPGLIARAEASERLADGMRWRFEPAPDLLAALAAVIEAERSCCRFLRFAVTVEPDLGPIWLAATGPAGTADFLEALVRQG